MIKSLSDKTTSTINLENKLTSIELSAHQQVHLLQIIHEATINAIKHANATNINISCISFNDTIEVSIIDDGRGFNIDIYKPNHYGIGIMKERAASLGAKLILDINNEDVSFI